MSDTTLVNLIKEFDALDRKHAKLDKFISDNTVFNTTISEYEQNLMIVQRFVMFQYMNILRERIQLSGGHR